jgi:spore coat protein CotF
MFDVARKILNDIRMNSYESEKPNLRLLCERKLAEIIESNEYVTLFNLKDAVVKRMGQLHKKSLSAQWC